jgi:hypothetical protein
VTALAVDPTTSDVIVAGQFVGSVDLGTGALTTIGNSDSDIFVTELRAGSTVMNGGTTSWVKQLGGKITGTRTVAAITADTNGVVYLVGTLAGDLSNGSTDLVSAAPPGAVYGDLLFVSFDPKGTSLGDARSFSNLPDGGAAEMPSAIAIDPTGKTLFTGSISGTVNFGDKPLMASATNTFLAKFAGGSGGKILYSDAWGPALNAATSVAVDQGSNIILSGVTGGTINFGGMNISNPGQAAPYLVKFDPSANHIWSKGFGDVDTGQVENSYLAVDPKTQQVVLGLGFQGVIDIGTMKLGTKGGAAFLVAKFNP